MPATPTNPTNRPPPEYFDYVSVACEAGISASDLAAIESRTSEDYPDDPMMFELRMLRTCNAIKSGAATVRDALTPDPDAASAA